MKPKTILQRVLDFALAEIDRRARPVELPVSRAREREEPSARSHDDAPHEQLASDRAEAPAELAEAHGEPAEPRSARAELPTTREVSGLEAVRGADGERLTLRWAIGEEDVARAESLLSGKAVLCLRVVSFSPGRDDVVREVRDRPGVEMIGECELSDAPQRAVVALGLRTGERFVSIAHHVL